MLTAAMLPVVARAAAPEAEETSPLPVPVARIQRVCLRAYPPEMLAAMTSGADRIPAGVDAEPEGQIHFLDQELPLDKGLFYPSLLEELLPAFRTYLSAGSSFLDLGSGDGRVLFLANVLGAAATGIEYDETLVEISRRAAAALADALAADRLEIVQGDFFEVPWSGYDVVYYFDQSSFEQERIRDKLRRELGPETRLLVGHEQTPFPGFELEREFPDLRVYRRSPEPAEPP